MLKLLFLVMAALVAELERARDLYRGTEYRAALAALKPAESADPAVWHLAGRAEFGLTNYGAAQTWFQKAAAAEPARAEHLHWLGKAFGRRAETSSFLTAPKYASECRKAFEKAVEVNPKYTEAWSDLLEYYLSAPGFLGGGMDKAERAAARIGELDPVEKHFALARIAEAKKDLAGAEKAWRRATELAPKQPGRWNDLGRFLARQKRFAESDQAFDRALAAEAGSAAVALKVGYARAETLIEHKRNPGEAARLLDAYIAAAAGLLTPDDPSRDDARKLRKKIP